MEAVIMLPVLGLLLIGTIYLQRLYQAHQRALLRARSCTWQHALAGCIGDRPPGCTNAGGLASSSTDEDTDKLSQLAHVQGNALGVLDDLPIVGDALRGLLGTKTAFSATLEVPTPWLEKERTPATATFVALCNEVPTTGTQVALDFLLDNLSLD